MRPLEQIPTDFLDHAAYCRESLVVETDEGKHVPFKHSPAQVRLNQKIDELRAAGKPVRILFLKARRVQISTATAGRFFHQTAHYSGQHTAVIAHDEDTALNLFGMYQRFAERYKPFANLVALPRLKTKREGRLEWENGSWVQVATARNVNFGRSFNLRRVHFSEFAFYDHPAELMLSVMQAVPKDPDTMVVVESTAKGIGNEFHRLWLQACDPTVESDWVPLFFAWWEFPAYTKELSVPPAAFQASMSQEERELKRTYELTLEQLNWRRSTIANDCGHDVQKFRQEYPSNPEEAFIASGRLRFDLKAINRMPVIRNAPRGGLEREQVGHQTRLFFMPRERGELTLFRKPEKGRQYIIGADSAEGIDAREGQGEPDPDFSVAQVFDRDTGEQVATMRERMTPSAFGEELYWLGLYYNYAGIVPEVNSIGIGTVDELLRQGYPPQMIYHRFMQPDEDPNTRANNLGWKTTTVTRQQLLSKIETVLREMSLILHDAVTVAELMTFVIKPNGKAEAQTGCHDDTVLSYGLAAVGVEQMPRFKPTLPGGREAPRPKKIGRKVDSQPRGRKVRVI